MLKGYTPPLSTRGQANVAPVPPWHYSGDLIAIEFWSDQELSAASLPPGLKPDQAANGHALALFADWQFTAQNNEFLDPERYQFREFILLVDATYLDTPVSWCQFDFVDNDSAMARGLIQGHPKKLGSIYQTRTFAAPSAAAAPVSSGTRFAASLSAHGYRLAEGRITLHHSIGRLPAALTRPIISRRYFPRMARGFHDKPAIDELTMGVNDHLTVIDTWVGSADLIFPEVPGEELHFFEPKRMGSGYRFSMSFSISDLEILEDLTAAPRG